MKANATNVLHLIKGVSSFDKMALTQLLCCVVIPAFEDGLLPPGVYPATLLEVTTRLGWTRRRLRLMEGLRLALTDLSFAGCGLVYLDGSFVTAEDFPNDFDLCWETGGVNLHKLHPILQDTAPPRTAQKIRYFGDVLPNVREASMGQPIVEFFQNDKSTNRAKGIVSLILPVRRNS